MNIIMQWMKRTLVLVSCVVLVAIVATLTVPKAVHAMVAALVQDVDNPGRAALVTPSCTVRSSGAPGEFNCALASGGATYTVPAGYRLVIDQVSGDCLTPGTKNTVNGAFLTLTEQGNEIRAPFAMISQGTVGQEIIGPIVTQFTFNQSARYYADPGTTLQLNAATTDATGTTECAFLVSGHLISYP